MTVRYDAHRMSRRQEFAKRLLDVVLSTTLLLLAMPLMLAIAIAIRLTSAGPAVFRQDRIGRDGLVFEMLKFRTMVHDPSGISSTVTVAGDPRIYPLGRLLRRTKLDELPQLWNVLRGEMSLVGPRPDVPGYADQLTGPARRLLSIRPGITGPATLYFRDEEELLAAVEAPVEHNYEVVYPIKTRLNLAYIDEWSMRGDLAYLAVTVLPPLDRWLRIIPRPDEDAPAQP